MFVHSLRWLFLLIMLVDVHVSAQDQHYIDSLKQKLDTKLPDTTRAIILDRLSNILPEGEWEEYNEKTEKFVAEKIEHAAGKERKIFTLVLASAYNNKSLIYKYNGEITKALDYGEKSLAIFKELNDQYNMGIGSYNNGRLYYSLGDVSRAVRSFEYALKMIGSSTKKELLPYCLNSLGFISKEQQDFEKAMEFHQKAYAAAKQLNDDEALAYTITCTAIVLFEQKRFTEAQKNFSDALVVYKKIGDVQNQASELYHLGQVAYETNQYNDAMKNYDEALSLYIKRNDRPGLSAVYNSLGKLYFQHSDVRQAENCFRKSLTIALELGFPAHISTPAEGLYKVYRQKGEEKKALEMHELFVSMRDSVNNEAARKKVLKAQYRYEFEMKASADSILALGEKKVLRAQLAEEKTQRYGLVGGLVLLVVSASLGFVQFKTRQRLKELKLRNQIASDLHDEVGSAISSISLFAGMARMKQGKAADELVEKIEETSRETMNNMSDIVWSIEPTNDNFKNVIKKMKHFGQQMASSLNMTTEFLCEPAIQQLLLDMMQRKNIYLIYKEAINNACKHSKGSLIKTMLRKQDGNLNMTISDNGIGFNVTQDGLGHGISSLETRASVMGGKLSIKSSPSEGTTICFILPLT
jgi:two-component system, NarL family, sensor histidine kinase UhpB